MKILKIMILVHVFMFGERSNLRFNDMFTISVENATMILLCISKNYFMYTLTFLLNV